MQPTSATIGNPDIHKRDCGDQEFRERSWYMRGT